MTTLLTTTGYVIRVSDPDDLTPTAFRPNYFTLVFKGDAPSLTATLIPGQTYDSFARVTLDQDHFYFSEGYSTFRPPFSLTTTPEIILSDVTWDDGGTSKTATVLGYFDPGSSYYYFDGVAGDPLPVRGTFTDTSNWVASITSFGPPTGAYASGVDLIAAGLAGGGWTISEDDQVGGSERGATYATGSGNDTYFMIRENVIFDGGAGTDTLGAGEALSGLTAKLAAGFARNAEGRVTLIDVENVYGSDFDDILRGDTQDNALSGNQGDDRIFGGAGNDSLRGDAGTDELYGDDGDDVLVDYDGDTIVKGGAGDDVAFTGDGTDVHRMGSGNDRAYGKGGADRMFGNGDDDELHGEDGDDTLEGGNGDDILLGGNGDDTLRGGNNADYLSGDAGTDSLVGGGGADVFVFTDIEDMGQDRIRDFRDGTDLIDVSDFGLMAGDIANLLSVVGSNVRVDLGKDSSGDNRYIIIEDVALGDITSGDFILT